MQKHKILIVLPSLGPGGAERLAVSVANEWTKKGYEVEFIIAHKSYALSDKQGNFQDLLDQDIFIHDLKVKRLRDTILPLSRYFKKSKPDVIWVGLWPLTAIAIISWLLAGRIGRIYTIDHNQISISTAVALKIPKLIISIITRCTYPFANGIMAVSEGVKRDLTQLTGLGNDRVKVIYNPAARGIGKKAKVSSDMKNNLWGKDSGKCILSVGAFKEQKNFKLLIEAFSMFSEEQNSTLIILGEGDLRIDLEKQVEALGLSDKVFLPGFVDDPSPWFLTADLFVLSSNWEGLPTVLIESLDCGLPVVSTDTPTGPSEILEGDLWGILVPMNNAKALLAGIKKSFSKKHNPDALMERADQFSVKNISLKYLKYFELS